VLATAAGVFAVSYFASAAVQAGFAYLAAWFLLLGGMRPALELTHRRRRSPRPGLSDADQLARLTGVSRGVWVAAFLLVCTAALVLGTRLLIP
jgi:Peptidase M50B-like